MLRNGCLTSGDCVVLVAAGVGGGGAGECQVSSSSEDSNCVTGLLEGRGLATAAGQSGVYKHV